MPFELTRIRQKPALGALCLVLALMLLPISVRGLEAHARFGHGGKAISWPIAFQDSWFDSPGTAYRQDLATASLGMALSAFRKAGAPLQESHQDIQAFLEELGFEAQAYSQYDLNPTVDTIATAIAHKRVGDTPLLAVAISGGGYKDEWQSNFTIGDSLHHSGFDAAAQQVLQRIRDYLQQHRLAGQPFKLWVSGFSRAAATANRLGALLLDEGVIAPDRLYVYTFATPNVTKQADAASYPSIYNIVGAFDPVPMVPLADWGFLRFGQSHVLPAPQLNSDYSRRVAPVSAIHLRHTGGPYWSNFAGASAVGKLLGSLSESIRNTQEYTRKLQPLMMELWQKRSKPFNLLTSFIGYVTIKESSLRGVLGKVFSIVSNSVGERMLQSEGVFAGQWNEDKSLKENLAREHFPEGYLAWLSAYHSLDAMKSPSRSFRQVNMVGVIGVRVMDAKGELAAVFEMPDHPDYKEGYSKSLWFSQEGDELVISLPGDQDYQLNLVAMEGPGAEVRIEEGRAGYTRMQVYASGALPLPERGPLQLKLPAMDGSEAPGGSRYELKGEGGSYALSWQPHAAALSSREMSSSFTALFSQNLITLLAVLLLVIVLMAFSVHLAVRAIRRGLYKRRMRREGRPLTRAPFREHFFCRQVQGKRQLKLLSALLLLTSGFILFSALRLVQAWLPELTMTQTGLLYIYSMLYNLPVLALFLGASLPALGAAIYALSWLQDGYLLRTCRLHARIAFLFSLGMGLVLLLPGYFFFQRSALLAAGLQLLLLVWLLHLMKRILRRGHEGQAREGHALADAVPATGATTGGAVITRPEDKQALRTPDDDTNSV